MSDGKWRTALKLWNEGKEYWAIPRKNTGSYEQVRRLMQPQEVNAPIARVDNVMDPRIQNYHRQLELDEIERQRKNLGNFTHYYPDSFMNMNANEKRDMFNIIYDIMDTKTHGNSFGYKALKDEYDAFEIPVYAKRGYQNWLNKGRPSREKMLKGRVDKASQRWGNRSTVGIAG